MGPVEVACVWRSIEASLPVRPQGVEIQVPLRVFVAWRSLLGRLGSIICGCDWKTSRRKAADEELFPANGSHCRRLPLLVENRGFSGEG